MSTRSDMHHGRQGGHWLPDNFVPTDRKNAPTCDICGGKMLVGQKRRHHACDAETIVGERCVCKPGCTAELVGDGHVDCAAECQPCRIMRNRRHRDVPEWQR